MTRRRRSGGRKPELVVLRPQRRVRGLKIVGRLSSAGPGFLTLERLRARNLYDRGSSAPYTFEVLHRRGVDAVAIIPFFLAGPSRRVMVVCNVGFRPGLYRRAALKPPVRDRRPCTSLIECVAGSLEPGDRGERGVTARARRELLEETGLRPVGAGAIDLGAGFFPSHGQSTEKVHLRAFRVDPRRVPRHLGDGSINEADAGMVAIEAGRILSMCAAGRIEDPKLEIGVSRLLRRLSGTERGARRAVRRRTPGARL